MRVSTDEINYAFEQAIEMRSEHKSTCGRKSFRIEQVWKLFQDSDRNEVDAKKIQALMTNRKDSKKAAANLISWINLLWRRNNVGLQIKGVVKRKGPCGKNTKTIYKIVRNYSLIPR